MSMMGSFSLEVMVGNDNEVSSQIAIYAMGSEGSSVWFDHGADKLEVGTYFDFLDRWEREDLRRKEPTYLEETQEEEEV